MCTYQCDLSHGSFSFFYVDCELIGLLYLLIIIIYIKYEIASWTWNEITWISEKL